MDMLGVTFIAVSKVIVSVLIGVLTTGSIPNSKSTLRDFGFLISTVLLTSLTLSNTAQSVNLELLVRCSILIFFSCLMIVWGLIWGMVCSAILFRYNPDLSGIPVELRNDVRLELLFDEEEDPAEGERASLPQGYSASPHPPSKEVKEKKTPVPYVVVVLSEHLREVGVDGSDIVPALDVPDKSLESSAGYVWAMWVGCSTQNGVTLPISLLTNIASSVAFIDFAQAAAYIFVFAISYMLYLWAAGPAFVEQGEKASRKQRLIRELIAKHKRMTGRCDATTQTLSFPVNHVLEYDAEESEGRAIEDVVAEAPAREEDNPLSGAGRESGFQSSRSAHRGKSTSTSAADDDDDSNSVSCSISTASFSSTSAQTDSNALSGRDTRYTSAAVAISVPDAPSVMSPKTACRYAFTMATAEQLPYDWQRAGFIRVKYEHDMKALKKRTFSEKMWSFGRAAWGLVRELMVNPPFLSVVAGIVVGVITPVRNLFFDGGVLEMVMDAITLIGQGSIPASLLLLGANLVGSATGEGAVADSEDTRLRHAEQNTENKLRDEEWGLLGEDRHFATWYEAEHESVEYDLHNSFSLETLRQLGQGPTAYVAQSSGEGSGAPRMPPPQLQDEDERKTRNALLAGAQKTLSLQGISKRFVWGVIGIRLILAPAFSFVALIFMINTMPFLFGGRGTYDKTLIMVLLVELASPTAINSTLIFNARQFMTFPWAKMLFFQYILCTVTMVMWASMGLSYVSKLE
jgi:predicted permease